VQKEQALSVSSVRFDESSQKTDLARAQAELKKEQGDIASHKAAAERERRRAMQLLHRSHRLQVAPRLGCCCMCGGYSCGEGGKKKPSLTGVFGRAAQAKAAEVLQRSTQDIEEEERDA